METWKKIGVGGRLSVKLEERKRSGPTGGTESEISLPGSFQALELAQVAVKCLLTLEEVDLDGLKE
jgi:hypothetical protein